MPVYKEEIRYYPRIDEKDGFSILKEDLEHESDVIIVSIERDFKIDNILEKPVWKAKILRKIAP